MTNGPQHETETIEAGEPRPQVLSPLGNGALFADRYEIRHVLGMGGSAIVYAAWDTHVRAQIALKVLRPDKTSDRALTRFRREVNIARQLKAPNLVTVFDIGQTETSIWISMELVEGETLRALIAKGPLPLEDAIRVATQLLGALHGLHEHGVIHRDVKPGNVMITRDGDARLMDLGLARFFEGDETRATTTEHVVGTLEYLSPEQALGQELDPRSDLYSFGLVLFEMLAGKLPFGEQSTLGHLISHVSKAPPDVRSFRPDVPAWLARVVARLLEKKREHRYQSAEDALLDLSARRSSFWFGARRLRARATALLGAILVVSGLLAGWQSWLGHRFAQFVSYGELSGVALDRKGRELWKREGLAPGNRAVVARVDRGRPPRIVGVLGERLSAADPRQRVISVLDAQTGEVIRSHALPNYTPFRNLSFSSTFVASDFDSVDLNHDGVDEVVASWFHQPYWPSFTVYYDAELGEPRKIFYASGYHRFFGTADVDGDGLDELLFFGVNNRMGWHAALAALSLARIREPRSLLDDEIAASTPDAQWTSSSDLVLVWYALLPPFGPSTRYPTIDREKRELLVDSPSGPIVVGFDGFIRDHAVSTPLETRKAERLAAYGHARELLRLKAAGQWEDATEEGESALASARLAEDRILAEWIEQTLCVALIRSGKSEEADRRLEALLDSTGFDSNTAWSAATAYHAMGDLSRAVDWYRVGLDQPRGPGAGRKMYEFLEGAVLALGEMGRWNDARKETQTFREITSAQSGENGSIYAGWVEWRATGRPPDVVASGDPDLELYLGAEYALARGEDPASVLARAEEVRPLLSGKDTLIDSLRADCLLRLGRTSEAFELARAAWTAALSEREADMFIRGHFDLITDRAIRAAEAAGHLEAAAAARAQLDQVRHHGARLADR